MFVVGVDLFAQLVDELVEAEVDLGLDLVVQELLLEDGQRVVGAVVVQVQRVEDAPKMEQKLVRSWVRCFFLFPFPRRKNQ